MRWMSPDPDEFNLSAYDYDLPEELIAQHPLARREDSRLLRFDRVGGAISHGRFSEIAALFRTGDLLVVNDTRVFPARLLGRKTSGGRVEVLLLSYPVEAGAGADGWQRARALAMLKASKRPQPGSRLVVADELEVEVGKLFDGGKAEVILLFPTGAEGGLAGLLARHGHIPLPPYIQRHDDARDHDRYQTRYARKVGAVAAPTAGLHFSDELLVAIGRIGVEIAHLTLHVGYGTFAPVRVDDLREHRIHKEYVEVGAASAELINRVRAAGGRVWAVGTTTVRALEFTADEQGMVRPARGDCDLYLYPGYRFRVVDNLITNFHLPRSSLLFLVSALAGRENVLRCYGEAVARRYRFFSYGDAMVIVTCP